MADEKYRQFVNSPPPFGNNKEYKQILKELPKVKKIFKQAKSEGFFWVSFVRNANEIKSPGKFLLKPKNIDFKPTGKLIWLSPADVNDEKYHGSTWYSFAKYEMPDWLTLSDHFVVGYKVDYRKIYFIDSRRKLQAFHRKYHVRE
jgi:hypothetical protein